MSSGFRTRLAAFVTLAVVGAGLAVAPAAGATGVEAPASGETGVVSCLGNARTYVKELGSRHYPLSNYAQATSSCGGIHVKPKTNRYVQVCFRETGCNGLKLAHAGAWTTVATNVVAGTEYRLNFRSPARSTGRYAH